MIRYPFMTYNLHVFLVFDELYHMVQESMGLVIVYVFYYQHFHYVIYDSKKSQIVLGSGLEASL